MDNIIKLRDGKIIPVDDIKELGDVIERKLGKWSYRFSFEITYLNDLKETIIEECDEEVALKTATEMKGLRGRIALAMQHKGKE